MSYEIVIAKKAFKELAAIPVKINTQIVEAIDDLKEDPRPTGCKKLKGQSEDIWRIRVGDYRILYFINDTIHIVEIRRIGHRKDIYNK
ncbi:MAG TPA: type II toxin-antitoxin system RelE/ParE family toxin [Mucilaginibacter sp.]|nr:type II toxin-antitoxin system RelE/ParE family toxin [Mucilaginibacter sp.]